MKEVWRRTEVREAFEHYTFLFRERENYSAGRKMSRDTFNQNYVCIFKLKVTFRPGELV